MRVHVEKEVVNAQRYTRLGRLVEARVNPSDSFAFEVIMESVYLARSVAFINILILQPFISCLYTQCLLTSCLCFKDSYLIESGLHLGPRGCRLEVKPRYNYNGLGPRSLSNHSQY